MHKGVTMFEKEAEEKYCKGCKLRIEQCLWAWRNTNGLNEPNEKNCSCIKVPAYIAGAEFGYNKAKEEMQEQGLALQSDMDKTIEQNIALKEQIEKMKCCENCAKNGHICVAEEMQGKLCGKNKVKWQLRR